MHRADVVKVLFDSTAPTDLGADNPGARLTQPCVRGSDRWSARFTAALATGGAVQPATLAGAAHRLAVDATLHLCQAPTPTALGANGHVRRSCGVWRILAFAGVSPEIVRSPAAALSSAGALVSCRTVIRSFGVQPSSSHSTARIPLVVDPATHPDPPSSSCLRMFANSTWFLKSLDTPV